MRGLTVSTRAGKHELACRFSSGCQRAACRFFLRGLHVLACCTTTKRTAGTRHLSCEPATRTPSSSVQKRPVAVCTARSGILQRVPQEMPGAACHSILRKGSAANHTPGKERWYLFFEDGTQRDLRKERSDAGVQLMAPVLAHNLCARTYQRPSRAPNFLIRKARWDPFGAVIPKRLWTTT